MVVKNENPRRERSRNKVLIVLKNEPKRFKDLEKETELSPAGLTQILKILRTENTIEHTLIDGKSGYKLTKKGIRSLDDIINLANDVNTIRNRGGKHFRDYSSLWGSIVSSKLPWGIESDLTLDKNLNALHLLTEKDVQDIEELVFKIIAKNTKKRKLNEEQSGEIVLGFKIDYNELIKSINEDSLEYYENISKKESDILWELEKDDRVFTNQEFNQWKKLRKDTYAKIKKQKDN